MRVAVTDACIFIDLIELDLVASFFKLDVQLHTTVDVVNELFPEQKQLLKEFETEKLLTIHNLGERDINEMAKIPFSNGLSHQDKSVLYIAKILKNGIVISSDGLVRKFTERQKLECHGLIWVIDQLVIHGVCSNFIASGLLKRLMSLNKMYATGKLKREIEERILKWSSSS